MLMGGVVGDPGIEPGMGLPGGFTVRCRTLQRVAQRSGLLSAPPKPVNRKFGRAHLARRAGMTHFAPLPIRGAAP